MFWHIILIILINGRMEILKMANTVDIRLFADTDVVGTATAAGILIPT